ERVVHGDLWVERPGVGDAFGGKDDVPVGDDVVAGHGHGGPCGRGHAPGGRDPAEVERVDLAVGVRVALHQQRLADGVRGGVGLAHRFHAEQVAVEGKVGRDPGAVGCDDADRAVPARPGDVPVDPFVDGVLDVHV